MGKNENLKKIDHVKEQISDALELPKEITMNLPKLTMVGNTQLRIENHKGIIEYTTKKIRINSKIGTLSIVGEGMLIRNIIKEEIVIDGKVSSIDIDG